MGSFCYCCFVFLFLLLLYFFSTEELYTYSSTLRLRRGTQSISSTINSLDCSVQNKHSLREKVLRTPLRLISVTVFNFTHPPVLFALFLILSASRFFVPDFPLLVPAPFLSSAFLLGITFPSYPTETLLDSSQSNLKTFFL